MLIGLGHAARVGKDTAAQLLVDHAGFERVAFADSLREYVYATNQVVEALVDASGCWEQAKLAHPVVRRALDDAGEHLRRIFGDDVLIRGAFRKMAAQHRTVITDVRHPNEVEAIRAAGGLLVKITRPGVSPLADAHDPILADFDGWDAVIHNDGTVEDLRQKLAALVFGALTGKVGAA